MAESRRYNINSQPIKNNKTSVIGNTVHFGKRSEIPPTIQPMNTNKISLSGERGIERESINTVEPTKKSMVGNKNTFKQVRLKFK